MPVVMPEGIGPRNAVDFTMDSTAAENGGGAMHTKVGFTNALNSDFVPGCEETAVDHVAAKTREDLENTSDLGIEGIVRSQMNVRHMFRHQWIEDERMARRLEKQIKRWHYRSA